VARSVAAFVFSGSRLIGLTGILALAHAGFSPGQSFVFVVQRLDPELLERGAATATCPSRERGFGDGETTDIQEFSDTPAGPEWF